MSTATILNYLKADARITGLLPGGMYRAAGGIQEISRQATPAAFDENGEVQPCLLIRALPEPTDGPKGIGGRRMVEMYIYHPHDSDEIDAVADLIYLHLQRRPLPGMYEVRYVSDVPGQRDMALDCPMTVLRYEYVRYRG